MRGDSALARASNLLSYKEYTQQDLSTNTWHDTQGKTSASTKILLGVFFVAQ